MSNELLPPLSELTPDAAHRLICADYLRAVAGLIESGALNAFELAWSATAMHKPSGRVVIDSNFLVSGAESEFMKKVEEANRKIQVEDLSEKLKDEPEDDDPTVS